MGYIEGVNRDQLIMFPQSLDEHIGEDDPVRFIDAFVDSLDLRELGFQRASSQATARWRVIRRALARFELQEQSQMKTPRNSPCPCGSGRKYKHCCGRPSGQPNSASLMDAFIELPPSTRTYYLDTCVWSELVKSEVAKADFTSYFQSNDYAAALSYFTLFELSRAPKAFGDYNTLFFDMRYNVWIPCLYDQVIESELETYPDTWKMRWIPISMLVDESTPSLLSKLANDSRFIKSRDDHYQFGLDRFMSLEQLKENLPPQSGEDYTPEDADLFAWCNAVDYLGRHFIEFLKPFKEDASSFKADKLLSLHIRSLFLFFKYYLHGQSPGKSDFLDFAHVSYAPYCDVYVTERNACNVLKRIKNGGFMLSNTRVLHIANFLEEIAGVPDLTRKAG